MNGFKKSSSQKKPLLQGFLLDFKKGKTIICLVALLMLATAKTSASDNNPVANPEAVVICGKARFTVLTPEMIRIEYSEKQQFEDRASFVVINRYFADVPQFTVDSTGNEVVIKTDALELRYKKGTPFYNDDRCNPNLSITMQLNGESIQWYPGKVDPYNLKGTTRTLDQAEGDVRDWLEDGLVSRSGWAVIDEKAPRRDGSYSLMFDGKAATNGLGFDWVEPRKDPEGLDMYFMGYGHDYKTALYDFTRVAGKMPLPPLFMFGYWYSKYQRYSEQDFKDIVNEIKSRAIPMDVLVVDMDWHRNGKTGSTANTDASIVRTFTKEDLADALGEDGYYTLTFPITLGGCICADIGASTGGFTDCMLQNGAKKVYAVDVGYGQLAWKLRSDPRVVCLERTNARYLTREQIPEELDFASVDVSFISLKLILPALGALLGPEGQAVCLVKPQFEAGKELVGKKGVVRDPAVHLMVLEKFLDNAAQCGFTVLGMTYSPIRGPEGNIEYLGWLSAAPGESWTGDLKELVRASHGELEEET